MRHTDKEIINELNRLELHLGRPPSYEEVRKFSYISPATFQRRMGPTWDDVKRSLGWIPKYASFDINSVTPEDGSWLSGLIDGEGCFRLQTPSPSNVSKLSKSFSPVFNISLRADDKPALLELERIIGTTLTFSIDNRNNQSDTGANPAYKIFIRDLPTLIYYLIPILEKYPLRTKKRYELPVFKYACEILAQKRFSGRMNMHYTDNERIQLDAVYHALSEMKIYNSDKQVILLKYNLPLELLENA